MLGFKPDSCFPWLIPAITIAGTNCLGCAYSPSSGCCLWEMLRHWFLCCRQCWEPGAALMIHCSAFPSLVLLWLLNLPCLARLWGKEGGTQVSGWWSWLGQMIFPDHNAPVWQRTPAHPYLVMFWVCWIDEICFCVLKCLAGLTCWSGVWVFLIFWCPG